MTESLISLACHVRSEDIRRTIGIFLGQDNQLKPNGLVGDYV